MTNETITEDQLLCLWRYASDYKKQALAELLSSSTFVLVSSHKGENDVYEASMVTSPMSVDILLFSLGLELRAFQNQHGKGFTVAVRKLLDSIIDSSNA